MTERSQYYVNFFGLENRAYFLASLPCLDSFAKTPKGKTNLALSGITYRVIRRLALLFRFQQKPKMTTWSLYWMHCLESRLSSLSSRGVRPYRLNYSKPRPVSWFFRSPCHHDITLVLNLPFPFLAAPGSH